MKKFDARGKNTLILEFGKNLKILFYDSFSWKKSMIF
jgi:hypothetical protein